MCVYLYVYISRCLYLYALDICTYYIADVYMKTTSCIPVSLSLYLWKITSLVEDVFFLLPESNLRVFLFDLFEGDHCSTAGIFGICWCSEIPFQGSHKWSLISPRLVLGWFIFGEEKYGPSPVCSTGLFHMQLHRSESRWLNPQKVDW